MSGKPTILYSDANHVCMAFNDLVEGEGVQSNQFLIKNGDTTMLLDPGGDLTYIPMSIALSRYIKLRDLDYIFASHQDPDIIASIDRWVMNTKCDVVVSKLWGRFLPHLLSSHIGKSVGNFSDRLIELSDKGKRMAFGDSQLVFVPAHFLHSVGNFQVYDPTSKILFSGDMGASIGGEEEGFFVTDFETHIPLMKGFHQRYMCSSKATKLWADAVRNLDIDILVPQHGRAFKGKEMIGLFLDWIGGLSCGIDLLDERSYQAPK
ncbi:MBL fold metallo-hydrolase [Marinicella rhabdoformis]|uniref:MBL fold metallo-hydrolase n=1 Tax=Marinicella rhabdoformis TaxID=2580566 RepID=UPI0012AEDBCF|nr:MBL fold metallo-hydrolase [Marinicella rhabdoformis]